MPPRKAPRISKDQAAQLTLARLASEDGGAAYLSGDLVATADDGSDILSIIHLDDRRHWNLTVRVCPPFPPIESISQAWAAGDLDRALGAAADGDVILIVAPEGAWTLTVDVLELAKV